MLWLLPIWLFRIIRLLLLRELTGKEKMKTLFQIAIGGLVFSYGTTTLSYLFQFGENVIWWYWIPLPYFDGIILNIYQFLYMNLILNVFTKRALTFKRIAERWKIACIRCNLLVPSLEEKAPKEIPQVIYSDKDFFRIAAKGLTAAYIEGKKTELSNACGLFIWSIRPAKGKNGEVLPGLIDVFYTKQDLPTAIKLKQAQRPQFGQLNFGVGLHGDYFIKLTEMIHTGIAGLPGSGKSVQLRSLIVQAMVVHPGAICIGLDFKSASEFHIFAGRGNFILTDNFEEAAIILDEVYQEYFRRAELVKKNEVENVYQIRGPNGERVNPIFIFGDEMAEVFSPLSKLESKETVEAQKLVIDRLSKLARLARFVGVHLILATQRPDAKAIDPQVRSMLKTRIAFKLSQKEDSILWLNRAAALELPDIPGRFLLATDSGIFEQLQGLFVSKQEVKQMLEHIATGSSQLYRRIKGRLSQINSEGGSADGKMSEPGLPGERILPEGSPHS